MGGHGWYCVSTFLVHIGRYPDTLDDEICNANMSIEMFNLCILHSDHVSLTVSTRLLVYTFMSLPPSQPHLASILSQLLAIRVSLPPY